MRMAAVRLLFLLLTLGPVARADPPKPADSQKPAGPHKPRHNADLADTLDSNVIFSKFAALVQAADQATFLSSRGPFTLFVPTNSAFAKLPPGMFEDLLRPENKTQLQRLVLFHLVNGKAWYSKDIKAQKSLVSCEGNPLPLKTSKAGTLFVNKAKVLRADEHCSNGMLDEVDSILMPPQMVLVAGLDSTPAPGAGAGTTPAQAHVPSAPTPDTSEADTNVPPVPPMQ
jgi:uncharacterized surface protein with fasciclin (FAS1) repeats